jgi:hypothetical protein
MDYKNNGVEMPTLAINYHSCNFFDEFFKMDGGNLNVLLKMRDVYNLFREKLAGNGISASYTMLRRCLVNYCAYKRYELNPADMGQRLKKCIKKDSSGNVIKTKEGKVCYTVLEFCLVRVGE